uniref:Cyclic nucleotide-binding domain-containing protein n=1 Tax=Clastoptera arizonana TaxID=38151 RepID=A0A1B6C4Y7_9HEMI
MISTKYSVVTVMSKISGRSITSKYDGHRLRRRRKPVKISGKNRFRALVRHVIENRGWLETVDASSDITDDAKKNIRSIQSRAAKGELRINKVKKVLRKDYLYRTEEEKSELYVAIGNMKCFQRYPEEISMELVARTYFVYYGPNRILFRQGHNPTCMGVLLKGELEAYITFKDPVFGTDVTERMPNIVPGAMVGEVALLHEIPRNSTVKTATAVELLILNKDDFTSVLKNTLMKQWEEVQQCLLKLPHFFSRWTPDAVRECSIMADLKFYKREDIIFNGEIKNQKAIAYFIIKGFCNAFQKILVKKTEKVLQFVQNQEYFPLKPNMEYIVTKVCVLSAGTCFGLGERTDSYILVAESEVEILRIPLYILNKYNPLNIWNRTKISLDSKLPDALEVFNNIILHRKWEHFKAEIISNLKHRRSTSLHDVAYYWRSQKTEL